MSEAKTERNTKANLGTLSADLVRKILNEFAEYASAMPLKRMAELS